MPIDTFVLTKKGQALLAKTPIGASIPVTRWQIGTGVLVSELSVEDMTALVNPLQYIPISSCTNSGNKATVLGQFINTGLSKFVWEELGLWATDPDEGEILYAVAEARGNGETIEAGTAKLREFVFGMELSFDNAANVITVIDTTLIFATRADLEAHNKSSTAHPALKTAIQTAQNTADAALEAITYLTHTIEVVPSQNGSLTYTGNAQSPQWNSYDSDAMTLGGTTSATDAGTYQATFTPNEGYHWADGTTEAKTVSWTIGKATGTLTISKTSITLNSSTPSTTFTIGGNHDGTISVISNNSSVVSVSRSGNTVTVSSPNRTKGSATITVSCTAGTNYTAPGSKTCAVTADFVPTVLNSASWAQIREVSNAGQGENYWDVGDTKTITINGSVEGTTFSNLSIDVYIIGFNHNSSREGSNRIHFKLGKISGTQVALCSDRYGETRGDNRFCMNDSETTSGGWKGSKMRTTILGSDSSPTSPRSGTLMAALPSDMRNVMKSIIKYSGNSTGGTDNASYVTSTTEYLPLLSEFEVFGVHNRANSAEQNYQKQYAYYQAGNSKGHYKHNARSTSSIVWLRSVSTHYDYRFCAIAGESEGEDTAAVSYGIAPCFAV